MTALYALTGAAGSERLRTIMAKAWEPVPEALFDLDGDGSLERLDTHHGWRQLRPLTKDAGQQLDVPNHTAPMCPC